MDIDTAHERTDVVRDYLAILSKRWWIIVAFALAATAASFELSRRTPAVYQASATVVVDPPNAAPTADLDLTGVTQQSSVDTLAEIARSRTVADRALERLGGPPENREQALRWLQGGARAQRLRGTDLLRIEAQGPTPDAAARAADALTDAFLAWHIDARRTQAAVSRRFIEGQLAEVERQLRPAEYALAQYKVRHRQIVPSHQSSVALTKLAEFEAQRRTAGIERQAIEASLRQARAMVDRVAPTVPASLVTGEDPVGTQLRTDLAKSEVEFVGLRTQFTERHPQVAAARARIEQIKAALRQHTTRVLLSETTTPNPLYQDLLGQVARLEVERQALQARESALGVAVARYTRDVQAFPTAEVEFIRLTRDLKIAEETYLLLLQKLYEARIAEASVVGDLRVVDRAAPPPGPISPQPYRAPLRGALFGMLLGLGAVYLQEGLDTSFRTAEEAAQALGLPVLATIPVAREVRRRRGREGVRLVMTEHRRSVTAEAFRHLRTALMHLSTDRPVASLLVTSAVPFEGKSTVAANLAVALSQAGRRIMLLECDLRRPPLAKAFRLETAGYGLADLLADGLRLNDAARRTPVENLWFLPAGTIPTNPAELLGSERMRSVLAQTRSVADLVVLDAPPVLPVADATTLAPYVDAVILVVQVGHTPRGAARLARERLDAVGARIAGIVVTGPAGGPNGVYSYHAY